MAIDDDPLAAEWLVHCNRGHPVRELKENEPLGQRWNPFVQTECRMCGVRIASLKARWQCEHSCSYSICDDCVNRKFKDIAAELSTSSETCASTLRQRAEAVPWELRGTKEFNQLRCLIAESTGTELSHAFGLVLKSAVNVPELLGRTKHQGPRASATILAPAAAGVLCGPPGVVVGLAVGTTAYGVSQKAMHVRHPGGRCDPLVLVEVLNAEQETLAAARSHITPKSRNPVWNQTLSLPAGEEGETRHLQQQGWSWRGKHGKSAKLAASQNIVPERWELDTTNVRLTLYDKSVGVMDQTIGEVCLPLSSLLAEPEAGGHLVTDSCDEAVLGDIPPYLPCRISLSVVQESLPQSWTLPKCMFMEQFPVHVFMMTRGTRGDVQPFVALARGLAEELGWLVTICTEATHAAFVQKHADVSRGGIRFRPSGGNSEARMDSVLANFLLSHSTELLQMIALSRSEAEFFSSATVFMDEVLSSENAKPVDLIIFGGWANTCHASDMIAVKMPFPECCKRKFEGKPRTLAQARQTLQCIIKILYKRLFDKIVASINEVSNSGAARQSEGNYHNIGTLDIYGFERLESNNFEQLCINLANERLQQFFVEEVLEAEQRMYRDERLNVHSMELPDSAPVVSGIHSVLRLLDEHSLRAVKNLVREGAQKDSKFCEQVYRELIDAKQPSHRGTILALKLKASRTDRGPSLHDGFQIAHYAGPVSYTTKGWIDKNNDSLVPEIEAILADADRALIADMADRSRCQSGNGGERLCSVSSKYLSNLTNLLDTLKKCSVHYIRCFNPNQERKAGLFKPKYVLDQVIQCGTVELVNIMHHGYPHRCIFRDLRARFQKLLPREFEHYSDRDFMHAVMLAREIDDNQWTLGTSRLFLKAGQLRVLEELRDIGGQASEHVIKKIRLQFAKKKLRAFAHAIELLAYLRRVMLQGKRERTYAGLRRAIRIMVRVNRWKNRALRLKIAPFSGMDEQQEAIFTRKLGVGFQTMSLNLNATMLPQLFVTMGAADMPLIHAKLQKEMTSEEYDASWQAEAQESVLYFNDGVLKCAKLLGGAFAATTRTSAGAICDVRAVDCCSSGRSFAVSTAPELEKLRCICQSHENSQMFAHCERSNTIMLWRWMGATKPNQPVVAAIASFKLPAYWQVYQMCFLPSNPARPGEHVLAILGRMHDCNWLAISVYTVSRGRIALNTIKNVYLNLLDEALQNEGASISHFNLSHSGRTLILAGNRLLRLYSVASAPTGVELDDLDPQQDCEAHILGRDPHGTVTAVCALPMDPDSRSPGFLDWIWLGVSSGDMFGILLEETNGAISVATSSGRFRRNTHSQGVPIQAIVAVHEPLEGDPRSLHHSLTMRKPMMNPNAVLSISADGKLLHSERRSHQWQPVAEWQVPLSLEALRCGFAARCSALIPQVLLLADEGRQCLIAYDQRQPVNSGMSMCSFV
eukprot:s2674_g3.t1